MFVNIVGILIAAASIAECALIHRNFLPRINASCPIVKRFVQSNLHSPYERFDKLTERALNRYHNQEASYWETLKGILQAAQSVGGAFGLMVEHRNLIFGITDDAKLQLKAPIKQDLATTRQALDLPTLKLNYGTQVCQISPTPFSESASSFLYRGILINKTKKAYHSQVIVKIYKSDFINSHAHLELWLEKFKERMPENWSVMLKHFLRVTNPYQVGLEQYKWSASPTAKSQLQDPNADLIGSLLILYVYDDPNQSVLAVLAEESDYFDYITGSAMVDQS